MDTDPVSAASTVNKIIADSEKVNVDVIGTDDYGKTAADEWDDAVDGMKLIYLNEPKFKGYILLIRDPKRVSVGASSENYASAAAAPEFSILRRSITA